MKLLEKEIVSNNLENYLCVCVCMCVYAQVYLQFVANNIGFTSQMLKDKETVDKLNLQ